MNHRLHLLILIVPILGFIPNILPSVTGISAYISHSITDIGVYITCINSYTSDCITGFCVYISGVNVCHKCL